MSSPLQNAGPVQARRDIVEFDPRLRLLVVLFFVILGALGARLWHLQVSQGEYFSRVAGNNFVRTVELAPDRGVIYDRHGRLVAENRPSYDVHLTPLLFRRAPEGLAELARVLSLSEEETRRLEERIQTAGRADVAVRRDITRDQLATLEMQRARIPGVYVSVSQRRHYPWHATGAHVLGYTNEIMASELQDLARHGYRRADYIGRTGVERAYEAILRGFPGMQRRVVDALGNPQPDPVAERLLGAYRNVEPIPGRNLVLTIDMRLQQIIEEEAADVESAGIVAVDPRDGSILASFSKPGFNPNAWSGRLSQQEKWLSDNNPYHPMLDKAVQSWFPGSTYKIVAAIAGQEEGILGPHDQVHCPGYMRYGNRVFGCWKRSGHGDVDLRRALAESCNVYFYQVGLRLGMERMARYAEELGFGERPGLGFNAESAGLVPTRQWHEDNSPGGFQYGFILNTAVGQGDVRVSPLQLALAYAALANGGTLHYPRIVDRIVNAEGSTLFEYPTRERRRLPWDGETIRAVNEGLLAVVDSSDGTANDFRIPWLRTAGKTGTTQVRALHTARLDGEEVYFRDRDHAWYAAFAPFESPRIAIAVFIEHGGRGSAAAAPIAIRVMERYLREVLGWDDQVVTGDARNAGRQVLELAEWRDVGRFVRDPADVPETPDLLRALPPARPEVPRNRRIIGVDD